MTYDLTIEGTQEFKDALRRLGDVIVQQVDEEVESTAFEYEANVKLAIQTGPHTGRVYKRGGVTHQASAPGQPPASDTGALSGSIYTEPDAEGWVVGSRLAYAAYLEYGTRKMASRPVWTPEAEKIEPEFQARLMAIVEAAS